MVLFTASGEIMLIQNSSVTSYSTASAELTLCHNFPKTSEVQAAVDVRLILEKLKTDHISIGQWVNAVGYIAISPAAKATTSRELKAGASIVHIQALMLWSAGPLDITRYEACLVDRGKTTEPEASREKPPDTG